MSELITSIVSHGAAFVAGGIAVAVWLRVTGQLIAKVRDKLDGDE